MMKRFLLTAVLTSVLVGVMGLSMGLSKAYAVGFGFGQPVGSVQVLDGGVDDLNPAVGAVSGTLGPLSPPSGSL